MIDQYPPANGVLTSLIWRKTAAGGETSLSGYDNASQALSYTPGQEQVYLNGILLVRALDYTATNGTSITGLTALAADDFVQINCYNNFSVASVPAASITGEVTNSQITSLATTKLTGTVANNQLANSSITINGSAVSLGGSVSLPGDIESVTAGTGISGGGSSGAVTITNSMATAIDAKGDLVVGTGADAFSRLAVGATNGHVLTVDSSEATGLKYAAVDGGGMTLLETLTLSGTNVVSSSIPGTYKDLQIIVRNYKPTGNGAGLAIRFNGDTGTNYAATQTGAQAYDATFGETYLTIAAQQNSTTATGLSYVVIPDYANSVTWKLGTLYGLTNFETNPTTNYSLLTYRLAWQDTSAITSVTFRQDNGGSLNGGSALIYGVK
jgi:hypothetical protein